MQKVIKIRILRNCRAYPSSKKHKSNSVRSTKLQNGKLVTMILNNQRFSPSHNGRLYRFQYNPIDQAPWINSLGGFGSELYSNVAGLANNYY